MLFFVLQIEGLDIKDIRKGYLCGDTNNDPPKATKEFLAQVRIYIYVF